MVSEFSQIIMAKVGLNSAVQGRAEIPEGASKLAIIFPKPRSNRSEKKLQRIADSIAENGMGALLMDLWDEEEGGNPTLETSMPFVTNRINEIVKWASQYPHFKGLEFILAGIDESGDALSGMEQRTLKFDNNEKIDIILERVIEAN